MSKRTDFKFTKQYGKYSKDHVIKNMDRAQARSLQDIRKVGKLIEPKNDKAEPKAKARETK